MILGKNRYWLWMDDPTYKVVQLRNQIVDLVENRIAEVPGVTDPEEFYVLAPIAMLWREYVMARLSRAVISYEDGRAI